MAFVGEVVAGPILELEIVLLSFPLPPPDAVLKKITPPLVPDENEAEPRIEALVIVLLVASPIKRTVLVVVVVPVLVFEIVREFPPVFNPSIVTLSAPLRSIRGEAKLPEMIRAAPAAGDILIDA